MMLNIKTFQEELTRNSTNLITLSKQPQFSSQSTSKIRTIVKLKCFKSGQETRNFNDKFQHDAGEFMLSLLEHLFKETLFPLEMNEQIFGGLFQERISCRCGKTKVSPIQKLPEVWNIQLNENIQSSIEQYLSAEEVELNCERCTFPRTKKQINLSLEPNTILLQLNRYDFDHVEQKSLKKHNSVFCPKQIVLPGGSTYTLSSHWKQPR